MCRAIAKAKIIVKEEWNLQTIEIQTKRETHCLGWRFKYKKKKNMCNLLALFTWNNAQTLNWVPFHRSQFTPYDCFHLVIFTNHYQIEGTIFSGKLHLFCHIWMVNWIAVKCHAWTFCSHLKRPCEGGTVHNDAIISIVNRN